MEQFKVSGITGQDLIEGIEEDADREPKARKEPWCQKLSGFPGPPFQGSLMLFPYIAPQRGWI